MWNTRVQFLNIIDFYIHRNYFKAAMLYVLIGPRSSDMLQEKLFKHAKILANEVQHLHEFDLLSSNFNLEIMYLNIAAEVFYYLKKLRNIIQREFTVPHSHARGEKESTYVVPVKYFHFANGYCWGAGHELSTCGGGGEAPTRTPNKINEATFIIIQVYFGAGVVLKSTNLSAQWKSDGKFRKLLIQSVNQILTH